jgi:sulfatase modifying factor 1
VTGASGVVGVTLEVSSDGGVSWVVPVTTAVGAVGGSVVGGVNLRITWNAGVDWPGQVSSVMRYRVKVDDLVVPAGFAFIPAGVFQMGDVLDGISDAPVHSVTVSAFYIAKTEATKGEWDEVRTWGLTHGYPDLAVGAGKGAAHPVQTVNWWDVLKWCNARSEKEGLLAVYYTDLAQTVVYRTGNVNVTKEMVKWGVNGYRLATEAEWEKAARGGLVGKRFPNGDTISGILANYYGYTAGYAYDLGPNGYSAAGQLGGSPYTTAVGSYAPNGYGLHDMAGNVWEWCWDWYGTLGGGGVTDPRGADTGAGRVVRGGCMDNVAYDARVSIRYGDYPSYSFPNIGFRVVRSSVP